MIKRDRNFDDLTERFARNIYGSAKGEVRLAVVWQHLLNNCPSLHAGRPLRILDAGCGLGQMGLRLAQQGHELVMNDVSEKMLAETQQLFAEQMPEHNAQFIHSPLQDLLDQDLGQFDLVLFHAVLEWLAEPKETLRQLLSLLKPQGYISLMFYNRDALIYRNLIRGNWRKAESGDLRGEEGGLTPYHPLTLEEVQQWLGEWKMDVVGRAGVRVIYDYMERRLRDNRPVEETVRIELKYAEHEPYLHLGRYLHVVAKSP